jgi:hypothetical protein
MRGIYFEENQSCGIERDNWVTPGVGDPETTISLG